MEENYYEEPEYPFFDSLKKAANLFVNLSLALLFTFILIKVMEFGYVVYSHQIPSDPGKILLIAILYDVLFWLKLLPFLFVPFVIMYFIFRFRKSHARGFGIIGGFLILSYLSLIKYFVTALVPLGPDLFGYSFEEIKQTIGTSAKFDVGTFIILSAAITVFTVLVSVFSKRSIIKRTDLPIGILILGAALLYLEVSAIPKTTVFNNDYSYNLSLNKQAFFCEKVYERYTQKEPEIDIYAINYIEDADGERASGFKYEDPSYPFLRKEETPDFLGNFFQIDSLTKPNIVLIVVEGLGRSFSGPNAYLGSFTPFLDSLADKSLYWENFLAAQGRTFAALPSILGSLPFAETCFSEMSPVPAHLSLYSILKKNGYNTGFYSGFDPSFDSEEALLKRQGVDLIISEKDYGTGFTKSPAGSNGFTWGYADRELFRKSIELKKSNSDKKPFVSVIQTVSMHSPFTIPDQKIYVKKFEDYLNKLMVAGSRKSEYRNYAHIYSTILYTDDALKYFFAEYAKLSEYKNTIFVITGDHRLPEIPMASKIDRYHVPLIIYSPLLKQPANFRSISSHLDITPTLLSLLRNNYQIKTPEKVTWIGSGIDTARFFRNIHRYPLKQTKNNLVNFVSGSFFVDQEVLFSISDKLEIRPVEDPEKLAQIMAEFNDYNLRNKRFLSDKKLIPDSLYRKFK